MHTYIATLQTHLNLGLLASHMTRTAYQIFQGNVLIRSSQQGLLFQYNEQGGTVAPGSTIHTCSSSSALYVCPNKLRTGSNQHQV